MEARLYRITVFALYQISLLLGILMLPFALVVRRVGLGVPLHRLLKRLDTAYERAAQ